MKSVMSFLMLVFLYSCHQRQMKVSSNQTFDNLDHLSPEAKLDSTIGIYRSLAILLPDTTGYADIHFYLTNDSTGPDLHDNGPYMAIGKLIDSTHIFAMTCRNFDNDTALFKFYRWDGRNWQSEGRFIIPEHVLNVECMHAGSSKVENNILVQGPTNMNGNAWQYFFVYKPKVHALGFSGKFFSSFYHIDEVHNSLKMDYFGSWYMDNKQVLYVWHNDSLVPVREAKIEMIIKDMKPHLHNYRLSYSINPDTSYSKTLKLLFSEIGEDSTIRQEKYWDHFWELK